MTAEEIRQLDNICMLLKNLKYQFDTTFTKAISRIDVMKGRSAEDEKQQSD